MEWHHQSSAGKKSSRQISAGKVMASVFWDSEGIMEECQNKFIAIMQTLTLKDETYLCYIRTHSVPRCKHSTSAIKTNLLMVYKARGTVCSESHTKHTNTM